MKILAVSDETVPWIYSPTILERCRDVDIVISCGDLPIGYLEYIASMLNTPCLYVRGNHDHKEISDNGPVKTAPEGWINLDARVVQQCGLRLAGLEGCLRYRPNAAAQYSQREQWWRAVWLSRTMFFKRPDIVVAHAPPFGIHDGPDQAHTGFKAHNWLIETFRPRLFLHGHQHRNYNPRQGGEAVIGNTLIVNVHPYRLLEL
jgi:uncharacterized protein